MKHIKNFRPLVLAAILVVTSAAAAVCGLVMKGQLQKYVGGYDDKWAIAVPFLMLRDDTDWQRMLAAKNAPPAPDPEPEPEPEPDPEPEPEPEPPVVVTNAVYGQDESFFDDALFIGDSDVDVLTARNAGLPCAGAVWGFRGREELAAAAQRAGLDTESTVTALPVGQSLYAYWADNRVLTELLQSDAALDDLRAATWEEWFDFVTAVTHWCAEPGAVQVTLNGNVYTLPAERRETLANLNGVFAAQGPEVSGNSGDGGVAENTPALYTTALLAAGEPLTEENLTGPLNALEQELRLEDANSAWQAGIADQPGKQ